MTTVFLSNGQACLLKEQIGNRFIVNKIYEYEDDEGDIKDYTDSEDILVDKIYTKQPTEKIDKKIKQLELKKNNLSDEVLALQRQKATIENQLTQLKKTEINESRFIINRSELINAKTLALFEKSRVMPKIMESSNKSFSGLRVSLIVDVSDGKERSWGYRLNYDYEPSGDYLCETYGILINPTQEQIDETIIKRLSEFEFSAWELSKVDNKYLTNKLLGRKNAYIQEDSRKTKQKLEKEIEEAKKKILQLESSLSVISE